MIYPDLPASSHDHVTLGKRLFDEWINGSLIVVEDKAFLIGGLSSIKDPILYLDLASHNNSWATFVSPKAESLAQTSGHAAVVGNNFILTFFGETVFASPPVINLILISLLLILILLPTLMLIPLMLSKSLSLNQFPPLIDMAMVP